MELQFEVTDITVTFAGYGHWDVTLQMMNLSNYSFFEISKITTNSIAVDEKDYYTLGKEVLDYHYDDISDVDISYLQNLS